MKPSFTKVLVVAVLCCAASAVAEPDRFHLGTGRDGALSVTEGRRVINSYARVTAPLAPGDVFIQVESSQGFAAGDLVMVLQTTGMVPLPVSGDGAPVDLRSDVVGRWEFARIAGVEGESLHLTGHLIHSYAADVTQIIRVPEYTTVDIRPGASLVAKPWDGAKGGVIALLVRGTLTNDGLIDASGMGFRGGTYVRQRADCAAPEALAARGARKGEGVDSTDYGHGVGRGNIANGGGGGACMPSGGGGGGNAGPGGQGGQPFGGARDIGGMGGAKLLYSLVDRLTLGGGGGGGSGRSEQNEPGSNGGRGGGAIFIRGGELAGRGSIAASGEAGVGSETEGAGGGGAGGSISVRFAGPMNCLSIRTTGGMGGNSTRATSSAPGGGGGGGRVLYQAVSAGGCPMVAEAGMAGLASDGSSHGAQPAMASESSLAGTVTRLPGGFSSPGQTSVIWPAQGANITTRTPTIIGAAPNGVEVVVYLDGREAGRAISEGGLYSLVVNSPLVEGVHLVQAATFHQGVQSEKSPPHTFSVEIGAVLVSSGNALPAAPSAPNVTFLNVTPAADGMYITSGNNLDIYGTAAAGSMVRVIVAKTDATRSAVMTQSLATGVTLWSVRVPNPDLTEGSYSLFVTASNADGTSPGTGLRFWVDTSDPAVPRVTHVAGKPKASSMPVNDVRPIIQGDADAGSTVTVALRGTEAQTLTTVADGSRRWSVQPPSDNQLTAPGSYTVDVTSTDPSGRATTDTDAASFIVDTLAPNPPMLSFVGGKGPASSLTIDTAIPVITGTTDSGSRVWVSVTKVGSTAVKTKEATVTGTTWTVTFNGAEALTDGDGYYSLAATATDAAGNTSNPTGLRFFLDTGVPTAPAVTHVAGKNATTGPYIKDARPIIQGSAEAGSTVSVALSGAEAQTLTTVADDGGRWNVQPPSDNSLTSGNYTVTVTATDEAGRVIPAVANPTFTLDMAPPNPPSVSTVDEKGPASNLTIDTVTPVITGSTDSGSTVQVSVRKVGTTVVKTKTATVTGTTWTVTFDGSQSLDAGDGYYALAATAMDAAGNTSTSTGLGFSLDTGVPAVPAVTYVAGKNAGTGLFIKDVRPIIQGTAEAGTTLTVTLNSSSAPLSLTTVADGGDNWSVQPSSALTEGILYTITVESTNAAGNSTSATANPSFTLDKTVPNTIISSASPKPLDSAATATFTFSASEGAVTYECSFDPDTDAAARFTDCSAPTSGHTISSVSEGTHILLVRAKDQAGNVDDTPASHTWRRVRDDAFLVNIIDGPRSVTNNTTASFEFTSNRTDVKYECKRESDGDDFRFCTPSNPLANKVSYSGLTDGSYSLVVRALDGTSLSSPDLLSWVVDTQHPAFADIREPAEGAQLNTRRPVIRGVVPRLDGTDGTDRTGEILTVLVEIGIGGEKSPPVAVNGSDRSWSYAVSADLGEGEQTVYVQVKDDAGNTKGFIDRKFVIDTIAPDTSTTEGPPSDRPISETSFLFNLSSNETVAYYECRIDSADFARCSNPYIGTIADGAHTLLVRARDLAGNVDPTPARYSWTVDTVSPNTSVSGPSAYVNSQDASFQFSSSESGVTFECSLDGDGSVFVECPRSELEDGVWSFLDLSESGHILRVRARDQAGNADTTPAVYSWSVDLTAPARPEISSPEDQAVVKSRASLLKGTAEAHGTVSVYVNGAKAGEAPVDELGNWSYTVEFEASSASYELSARAADRASNLSELSAPRTIQVDTVLPSHVIGGGLSCSSAGGAEPFLVSLGLTGLLLLCADRRRKGVRGKATSSCTRG